MDAFCKSIELGLNQSVPGLDFINVNASSFLGVCREKEILELDSANQAKYSTPMPVIGEYIAVASSLCGIFMVSDFVHAIIRKIFWVPMESFSLNATSLTVIAVAMKLPMDLTTPMPNDIDQLAKVGSLAFVCIIMSTLMPSLADMDNKSLLANVTALCILVITLIVNVGIEIGTQVIPYEPFRPFCIPSFLIAAYIYEGMLLLLLIIYISSAIAIPSLKKVLELKYQATVNDQNLEENIKYNVEELRQLVRRHWIMAMTSSPQFVMAATPLSSASNIICAISMVMYISLFWHEESRAETDISVYRGSTYLISIIHMVVVKVGSVGLIYRCFAVLRFKSIANRSMNRFSVFKVDKYWTQNLCERKENSQALFSVVKINYRLNNCILSTCIIFQKVTIVLCKIIEPVPIAVIIFVTYCSYYFKSLKALLFTPPISSITEDADEDLSNCVLLLEGNLQLIKYPVKRILDPMNKLIQRSRRHNNIDELLKLLEKSVTFGGVGTFDIDQIQSPLPIELVNCWSLPIISLTCIAIAITNIDKHTVDNLLKSVDEGLIPTRVVEATLNKTSEYVDIQRKTMTLWREVKDKRRWLDITLERGAYEGKTPTEIIKLFAHSSEEILNEFNRGANGELMEKENLPRKVITANSMYRVAQTILLRYESNNLEIIEDELFTQLSNMIADILAACLTNIPKVIIMKCCETTIEKRADSVTNAVMLLEQTSEIIKRLETRELPMIDPEKRGFIDEWRLHFEQP